MKKLYLFSLVLVTLTSCRSVKEYNKQITKLHSVKELQNDVDKVYIQLKRNHPKLYQYTPKEVLDYKFDSLKTSITESLDSRQFYKKLAPVVSNVKQGHIAVSSANKRFTKKETKQLKKRPFEFYDLNFEYLQNKLWVKNTLGKDSSMVESEVLKIEDEPVSNLMDAYKTLFSSDGYNKTLYNRFVAENFSTFYYKDKGFLDSLSITFKNRDSLFTKTLRRIEKEKKNIDKDSAKTIKPKKISKEEKQLNRLASKQKRKYDRKHGFLLRQKTYSRNFRFIGQDSTVGFMKIRDFVNGPYKKFYKESFSKIDPAKTKYLILDLRDNGGGRISEIDYLYSFLTDKDYRFINESEVNSRIPFLKYLISNATPNGLKLASVLLSPLIIVHNLIHTKKHDGKLYYKFKYANLRKPKPLNYKGNLYVLINGNSFSASSILSTHLQANKRATFVGEETGGAYNGTVAGIYKVYQLPASKLKIRMGLMQIDAPQKQLPDGYGIIPEIKIIPTIEDRKLQKDTELEWVLNDIIEKEKL